MFYWPIENPRVRNDGAGSGAFGARRTKLVDDERVVYPHRGVDLLGDPGTPLFAPVTSVLERNGICYNPSKYPARSHLKLMVFTFPLGRIRLLYVEPALHAGQSVKAGDLVGHLQDVSGVHPGSTNHVHFEILFDSEAILDQSGNIVPGGVAVNPMLLMYSAT